MHSATTLLGRGSDSLFMGVKCGNFSAAIGRDHITCASQVKSSVTPGMHQETPTALCREDKPASARTAAGLEAEAVCTG